MITLGAKADKNRGLFGTELLGIKISYTVGQQQFKVGELQIFQMLWNAIDVAGRYS